jgi:hypothetical protein
VSVFHCSCSFGADDAALFGDHLSLAFARADDVGTDGCMHAEVAREGAGYLCACGYESPGAEELNDHLLLAFMTPDGVGSDGERHVPVDTSTPLAWFARKPGHE